MSVSLSVSDPTVCGSLGGVGLGEWEHLFAHRGIYEHFYIWEKVLGGYEGQQSNDNCLHLK